MYNGIVFVILLIGLLFIITSLIKESYACDKQRIVYKYIPRTFEQEQNSPVLITDIFKKMFSLPSPWVDSIGTYDRKKQDKINQFFISQA